MVGPFEGRRPLSVTVAVVAVVIQAAITLTSGALLIGSVTGISGAATSPGSGRVVAYGMSQLLLGAVILVVGRRLRRGSSPARLYLTGMMIVVAALACLGLARGDLPDSEVASIISLGIALIVLCLLWNPRASTFFAAS